MAAPERPVAVRYRGSGAARRSPRTRSGTKVILRRAFRTYWPTPSMAQSRYPLCRDSASHGGTHASGRAGQLRIPGRLTDPPDRPPTAGDDEVLVRVRAASVHPDVWHVVTGRPIRSAPDGIRRSPAEVSGSRAPTWPASWRRSAGRDQVPAGRRSLRRDAAAATPGETAAPIAEYASVPEDVPRPQTRPRHLRAGRHRADRRIHHPAEHPGRPAEAGPAGPGQRRGRRRRLAHRPARQGATART